MGETQYIHDVETGASRTIPHLLSGWTDYMSRIGSRDEVPYRLRNGDHIEFRAWSLASNTSRLVRSMPARGVTGVSEYTLRGNMTAFSLIYSDSIVVYVSASPASPVQRIVSTAGRHTDGLSFSPNGRRLAFGIPVTPPGSQPHSIGFAELNADGTLVGSARLLAGYEINGLGWLPSGNEIVYLRIHSGQPATTIERLSVQEGARPRIISQQDSRFPFWDFSISPDGKWVLYPVDVPAPSAIWRVDLPGLGVVGTR